MVFFNTFRANRKAYSLFRERIIGMPIDPACCFQMVTVDPFFYAFVHSFVQMQVVFARQENFMVLLQLYTQT